MRELARNGFSARKGLAIALAAALCLAIAAIASAPQAYAHTTTAGSMAQFRIGQTFTVKGNLYRITDLEDDDDDREAGDVALVRYGSSNKKPAVNTVTYKGALFEVDSIGKNAFNNAKGHKITAVTVGKHVDRIGSKAFYGCKKLAVLNMRDCDVVDIDKTRNGYRIDEIDVGAKAFSKAGAKNMKVKCGKKNAQYRKLYKKALGKKGLRSDARVVC